MFVIFLSAFTLAFSGAMMPGPVLTYTIKQALNSGPYSGFIIIAGHAVLELILIVLIFLGFNTILQSNFAQISIGLIGGVLLIYMGLDMVLGSLKNKIKIELDFTKANSKNMFLSGIVISAVNPYFLLWWAIIGLGFLIQAYKLLGTAGVLVFYTGHILADFAWYGSISMIVGKTRKFIKENLYRIIIILLGGLLIFFGGSFLLKAILTLI
ncbi:MAG: LysE family transporter [Desulfitobacteriaceae bacterium]|nr:LysE family transporter [Desulfitobacteriaceae bacterium]MDD4345463.1 LysE family transporter [Desulfitobacteriaceae bacterium]